MLNPNVGPLPLLGDDTARQCEYYWMGDVN